MSPQPNRPLTRADLVRQRRQQSSQQRINSAAKTAARPPAPVRPVVARGAAAGRPIGQQSASRVRRQMYYSLGAERAEVRLPALPVIQPGWRLLSGMIFLSMLITLIVLLTAPGFKVETYALKGITRISPVDIEAALKLTGRSIFEMDPQQINRTLQAAFPELTGIKVFIGFPRTVAIGASERIPLLAWYVDDSVEWIDAEGVIMPARGDLPDLVTVRSNIHPPSTLYAIEGLDLKQGFFTIQLNPANGIKKIEPQILQAILTLGARLPAHTLLIFDEMRGLGWKDMRGHDVYLGFSLENVDQKIVMVNAIESQLEKQGIRPAMISVEYLHQPYFRTEQ